MKDLSVVESDFWKDIFVHMQHKNMMRSNGEKLYLDECQKQFSRFQMAHPDIQAEITDAQTYKTWEIFITPTIKLRLYIQNQIKASLLQKDGAYFTKLCDAKFQNNPFPEIEELLNNRDSYSVQLERDKNDSIRNQKKMQLAYQFIKALVSQKFSSSKDIILNISESKDGFVLTVEKSGIEKKYDLDTENFAKIIESI